MSSLSLVAGNCGRGNGTDDQSFEFGWSSYFGKHLFTSHFRKNSFRRLNEHWSKSLEGSRIGNGNRFYVAAKIKKGKKHDYPWPDDIDPNISSGYLTYLSHFKPLDEKPKPVTLPFEKPLVDLEKKIIEVRQMADDTGLDFSDQIGALENKYQQALKDLYTHLTPIQRLSIARHPNRPTALDHIFNITEKWVELHGDRAGYDDPAMITGIGSMDGKSYMFIGHQKGRNTKENIFRNFAMPTPHGYRKALRMMKYADHHGLPIITFVDTPGAFADVKSEELGQGEAIAHNLRAMFGLKVPIVAVVTGEGGSGGALAIACANKLLMLENSAFYVASPEACAAILWKSSKAAPKAAEKLRITAQEHYRFKIADGIIPEPLGGAHSDPVWTSQQIKCAIIEAMEELTKLDTEDLLRHRMQKFRSIGGFQEGIPVDPERKRNMKPSEVNMLKAADIESDLKNLKKRILEAKMPSDPITSKAIAKLREDVEKEITDTFISMGLQEKNLSKPGAYLGLKQKLEKLNEVNRLLELKEKTEKLKQEINQKVPAEVKAKMKILNTAQDKLSKGDPLDKDLLEEVAKVKKELMEALKSANLEILGVLSSKIEELKAKIAKGSSSSEVAKMEAEIKEKIVAALDAAALKEKVENVQVELQSFLETTTEDKVPG
ncbi:acetyl-coenzyme A carboxylase carboxyl transferase subunit alpha, chloroplastic-like [Melia azedarach]|uniref:Acetyl-coenzyme A carboxylase carboxyl transferase subunit alpha, chloroplastic-like n=1 Tax=Melia azedarach TaxID=155640 RepID=A0ACC1YTV8_MELAZ|nr:acetyl-coenzyme A carboxylase carboxyl transferase subunit alpha, chloroplastic-like [Melia azedarach]